MRLPDWKDGQPLIKGGCGHSADDIIFSACVVAVCAIVLIVILAAYLVLRAV